MTDRKPGEAVYPERQPLTAEQKAARDAARRAEADKAWAEMEEVQQRKYANMERLRAERLARARQDRPN